MANDILRSGNQYRSYEKLPQGVTPTYEANLEHRPPNKFVKIPPDLQENLKSDAVRIQKLKQDLTTLHQDRLGTPEEMRVHIRQQQL